MARLENTFKKYLMTKMGTRWDAQSHEDQYSDGIPDLSFGALGVSGWIELKQIPAYPKRADTLLKPSHYTAEQVNWLWRRAKRSGNCFVFVKVGANDYYLFSWHHARNIRKGMTRAEYEACCIVCFRGSVDPDVLVKELTAGRKMLDDVAIDGREHRADYPPLSQP